MAEIAEDEVGFYEGSLTAATVLTIEIHGAGGDIRVISDGTASVFVTVNGALPTVGGQHCLYLPAASGTVVLTVPLAWDGGDVQEVKLVSDGTPVISVARAD